MKASTGNLVDFDGVAGRVILRLRQSSEISGTSEKMSLIGGNGTFGWGHRGPASVALMIEFCAGMNGFGGANLPAPLVS